MKKTGTIESKDESEHSTPGRKLLYSYCPSLHAKNSRPTYSIGVLVDVFILFCFSLVTTVLEWELRFGRPDREVFKQDTSLSTKRESNESVIDLQKTWTGAFQR